MQINWSNLDSDAYLLTSIFQEAIGEWEEWIKQYFNVLIIAWWRSCFKRWRIIG